MTVYISRAVPFLPYIALVTSEKDYIKEMKRLKVKKYDWGSWITKGKSARAAVFTGEQGDVVCIVCIDGESKEALDRSEEGRAKVSGLLIHEAAHVWQQTKQVIGEDDPSPEFEAYAMQHIGQSLIYEFNVLINKRLAKEK